ncbi:MAG: J domain-containing protein [Thermoleophilia bacterium]|nr:J domain-containing protein [Thermoleophilia bacterium]
MAPSKTHYDVLGIAADADETEIKRAWKVLVQVWHPDRFTGEMRAHAEAQVQHINEAYGTLRVSDKRAAYDRRLAYDAGATEPSIKSRSASERGPFGSAPPRRAAGANSHHTHVGSGAAAMHAAAQPTPFLVAASEFGASSVEALRRNPRIAVACVSIWVLLVGGPMVHSLLSGPHVPADLAHRESLQAQRGSGDQGPDPMAAFDDASGDQGGATNATPTPDVADGATGGGGGGAPMQGPSLPAGTGRANAHANGAPNVVAPDTRPLPQVAGRADDLNQAPVDEGPVLSPGHHKVIRILPQGPG